MKYRINKLPIKTTNSFKINDLEIDLDPNLKSTYTGYQVSSDALKVDISKLPTLNSHIGYEVKDATKINMVIDQDYHQPVILNYCFTFDNHLFEEVNITVLKNVTANLILNYESDNNLAHNHYLKIVINIENNASLNLSVVNLLNKEATSLISIESNVLEHATLTTNLYEIGGLVKISNAYGNTFKDATNNLNVIYLGYDHDLIDCNYYYLNNSHNSSNIIKVEGLLNDYAKKTFRGTIKFISGATSSLGNEKENVLLLSNDVISTSAPLLLCDEEDVLGSHSVSSGRLDLEKIYYLMSRGLTKKEAANMLVMSSINPLLFNLNDKALMDKITNEIFNHV